MKRGKSQKRDEAENIKVLVRSRPLNTKELDMGMQNAVDLDLTEGTVTVNHVCGAPDRWTFDAVVNNTFSQNDIFIQFIQPLVDSALEGFNATIFAYGQSGSGKTYTMSGGALQDHELRGIIPRSFTYIFNHIREKRNPNITYSLSCSFLELYNGKIRDLLAKQQVSLQIKESKDKTFYVNDLSTPQVKFVQDLLGHMEEGNVRRQVAATELNTDSSRSHSIFTVAIQMVENLEDGECRTVTSKLNLVDLAGSERQRKTRASGDTLKEGCNINLSLSALGTVIDTIVKGKGHIPFRSSPLTMLLKDSLGGTSKTVMFANINPADSNISETVSTLRFADRAKQIKNKPVMQMDAKDQKIQELLNKVQDLQDKLKQYENNEGPNLEEENERLEERICVVEAELSAAREELSDAVGAHNKSLNLKEEELDKLRRKYEALEESLQQEQDNLKLMMHTVEESAAEVADIKDITISFLSEVNEKDAAPNTLDEIRSALQSIKEYMFNSCSEKTLEEEGRKQQEQHAEQCAALKEEILQLEKSMQDTRMSYKEEKQNRKAQAATHKKEIEAMKQDHKAEVTTVRSEQNHQGQVSSKRDADIAELEDKLKGVQELIGNKQDTIMLEQRIKMLEEELKNREDEESQTVQTCKEHLQKNKTSHEEALEEVNRLRQIVTEPWYAHKCKQHNNSDNDTEAVRRYKMDIHVLHNSLSTLRTEKDQLSQELQTVKKSSLAEEKKAMRLASKCRGLEVGQEKMKQIAAALPAEAVENCFEADMEAKAQALETGITQRDAALDTLRQELVLEIERSTTRYVALTEDRDRLLSLMVQPEEGEPDEVAKLKQTVAYLTAELQKENQEVGKMHEKATKTVLELADRNKQMLANSTSSAGTININAAEDDTNTLKRLEEASTRIRELETMLSEPQEGDNGILMELKQELRQSIKTTANLGCEVELSAQKLLNEQAMTKKLREEYHSLQEAAKGSNTEQLAQELKVCMRQLTSNFTGYATRDGRLEGGENRYGEGNGRLDRRSEEHGDGRGDGPGSTPAGHEETAGGDGGDG